MVQPSLPFDQLQNMKKAFRGDLEVIKKNHGRFTEKQKEMMFVSAIHSNNMECVKYMIENNMITLKDKPYCDIATKKGNLDCLEYLYKNGCKFNKYTALIAMIREDYKCYKFITKNGGKLIMPS